MSPQTAYLITSILSDDSARIPAFGEDSVLNLSRPAAAKTGTTTDFRDNWTLGYTPNLAVGVWAGNADNAPMYRVTGVTGAGPIWHDFMEEALRALPEQEFVRPQGIVEKEICDASGLLPTPICPRVRLEVFLQGTEPKQTDTEYQKLALDAATNLLWADGCRGPRIERIYRVYPPDAQDWAQKKGLTLAPEVDCMGRPATDEEQPTTDNGQRTTGGGRRTTDNSSQSSAVGRQALTIVSPAQNSVYEQSPQIPLELQQIEVSARLNQALRLRNVTLLVDGTAVGNFTTVPYRALWKLQEGKHHAQAVAVTTDGQQVTSELVTFTVLKTQ